MGLIRTRLAQRRIVENIRGVGVPNAWPIRDALRGPRYADRLKRARADKALETMLDQFACPCGTDGIDA
jgi:hypothetical protein